MAIDRNNSLDKVFQYFPNEEYWKLIIDFEYWPENNPLIFDEQASPGYLESVSTALYGLLKTMDDPLTLDFVIGLHDLAYHEKEDFYLGLNKMGSSLIYPNQVSIEGLIELITKIKKGQTKLAIRYEASTNNIEEFQFKESKSIEEEANEIKEEAKEILSNLQNKWSKLYLVRITNTLDAKQEIQRFLDRYYQAIKSETDEIKKLNIIATFIQDCHQYHPFIDGNGRVFVLLLLNKLLIMNGLSPTTLEKTGKFSGHSIEQLVREIQKGQEHFRELLKPECKNPIGLAEFLKQKLNMSIQEQIRVDLDISMSEVYKNYSKSRVVTNYIDLNLNDIYWKRLIFIYDAKVIDEVISKTPPAGDVGEVENLGLFYLKCMEMGNDYLLKKIDKYMQDVTITNESTVIDCLTNLPSEKLLYLIENKKLLDEDVIMSFLLHENKEQSSFFTLLTSGQSQLLEAMLRKLDPEFANQFLSKDYNGINGLQLISFFGSPTLIKYSLELLPPHFSNTLLGSTVQTKALKEHQLNKVDFNKLIQERLTKSPAPTANNPSQIWAKPETKLMISDKLHGVKIDKPKQLK